jgi:hypothetical protein
MTVTEVILAMAAGVALVGYVVTLNWIICKLGSVESQLEEERKRKAADETLKAA